MRIALVTNGKTGLASGIGRHVFELAVAQKARGDSPVVLVPESGEFTAACEEHGIPVAIEPRHAEEPVIDERSVINDLCSLFTSLGAEIIHCHLSNPQIIAAANRIGIPCVYTRHVQRRFRMPGL